MDPRLIIVAAYAPRIRRRCASPNTIMWSRHSRRIEPMSLSTYAFCQGDRNAIGRSRMPMARRRCTKTGPYEVSRSRMRYRGGCGVLVEPRRTPVGGLQPQTGTVTEQAPRPLARYACDFLGSQLVTACHGNLPACC